MTAKGGKYERSWRARNRPPQMPHKLTLARHEGKKKEVLKERK
jgi:hypothetical protein